MVKHYFKVILSLFLAISFIASSSVAEAKTLENNQEQIISETTEYYEDGSSLTVTLTESVLSTRGTVYSKTGSKTCTYKDGNGTVQWKFKLSGTFSVNTGVSATCTSASYSTSNLANGWSLASGSAKKSGNRAIGDGKFEHKVLFVVTNTQTCHIELTCDAYGNLS